MKALALLTVCVLLSGGCGGLSDDGPPGLRLGHDECAECGMMINEDRCSSALRVLQHGASDQALFDDIGCMMRYLETPPDGVEVRQVYVHNHQTRVWLKAGEATFVMAPRDRLKTPMASGIVAVDPREQANSLAEQVGGVVLDWKGVQEAWRARNSQRPGSKP